jgi:hypothetical protein
MLLAGICCAAPMVIAILGLPLEQLPPVLKAVQPLVCDPGWELVAEAQSCASKTSSNCIHNVCVSPDGERVDRTGRLTGIELGIGAAAVLLIGGGVVLGKGAGGPLTIDFSGKKSP